MEYKYLKDEKNEATIELDNQTVAEVMRVELLKDSAVKFAAWRKEHPEKSPTLEIRTEGKTVKKALQEAATSISKTLDSLEKDFSKEAKSFK